MARIDGNKEKKEEEEGELPSVGRQRVPLQSEELGHVGVRVAVRHLRHLAELRRSVLQEVAHVGDQLLVRDVRIVAQRLHQRPTHGAGGLASQSGIGRGLLVAAARDLDHVRLGSVELLDDLLARSSLDVEGHLPSTNR